MNDHVDVPGFDVPTVEIPSFAAGNLLDASDRQGEVGHRDDSKVTAIVVNYDGGSDLVSCVEALAESGEIFETLVVDNASTDRSIELLQEHQLPVRIISLPHNCGFAGAVNAGARAAEGEILLLVNPDVRVEGNCVSALRASLRNRPGVAAPIIEIESSGKYEFGASITRFGIPVGLERPSSPLYVAGCLLAVSREVFDRVGGFDARYFLFVEDVEFCWRALLAGFDVSVATAAHAWHRGGGSAPGGYNRVGKTYETTALRVSLRERNTLAMLIACAPAIWLPILVPVVIARGLLLAGWAAGTGNFGAGRLLIEGIWWNAKNLPESLKRRWSIPRTQAGQKRAQARLLRGPVLLRELLRIGWPRLMRTEGFAEGHSG